MKKTIKKMALIVMLALCVNHGNAQKLNKYFTSFEHYSNKKNLENTLTNNSLDTISISSTSNRLGITGSDICSEWSPGGAAGPISLLYLKVCEYKDGGSGYLKLKNENNKSVRLSYKIYFNNGKTANGNTNIPSNSETSGSSCFYCATKNGGGVLKFEFDHIFFEGEKGYW